MEDIKNEIIKEGYDARLIVQYPDNLERIKIMLNRISYLTLALRKNNSDSLISKYKVITAEGREYASQLACELNLVGLELLSFEEYLKDKIKSYGYFYKGANIKNEAELDENMYKYIYSEEFLERAKTLYYEEIEVLNKDFERLRIEEAAERLGILIPMNRRKKASRKMIHYTEITYNECLSRIEKMRYDNVIGDYTIDYLEGVCADLEEFINVLEDSRAVTKKWILSEEDGRECRRLKLEDDITLSAELIPEKMFKEIESKYGIIGSSAITERTRMYIILNFIHLHKEKLNKFEKVLSIDDGQDLNLYEYILIDKINGRKRTAFNIYGDINKVLDDESGIYDWNLLYQIDSYKMFNISSR